MAHIIQQVSFKNHPFGFNPTSVTSVCSCSNPIRLLGQ